MTERNFYLENIPLEEAQAKLMAALEAVGKAAPLPAEIVPLRAAHQRITAETIWARRSAPHYHAAAMDGYAVLASDTLGATETRPLKLRFEGAQAVNTGDPLPHDTNAVIMIEHVQQEADGIIIIDPIAPWQHVRMMGEDMVASELVLPANHRIRPVDLGALAGCGYANVAVRRQPFVLLIPSGDELVPPDVEPQRGQITEYNSLILAAQIEESGGRAEILPITPDDPELLAQTLDQALSQAPDLILILSGSSAGSRDYSAALIRQKGELLVHGIAIRPGHPVIIGMVAQTPVIGVPGYPVSAALTGQIIIQPLLGHWLGQPVALESLPKVRAIMTRKLISPSGDDDFVRVTLAQVGERLLAVPLNRGAGVISSLVRADGLAHVPRFSEGVEQGGVIDVLLYRSLAAIQQTLLTMGSHDPMLDLLAQYFTAQHSGYSLTSANVGSMGGVAALKRAEAHLAGMHLLDPQSGDYNLPYIRKQLQHIPLMVVTFAHREQGLMVAVGNPLSIKSFDDLPRLRYLNRQRGAGTRILLDYELGQRNIKPEQIKGYQREEYTHLAVALGIASGSADCGLGIRSAAATLGLDFVSVSWERYDLVIPQAYIANEAMQGLLETLNSASFKVALSAQAGYDTSQTGTVQAVLTG